MSEPSTTTIHSTHRLTNLFWVVCLAFFTLLAFYPERATAAKALRKVAVAEPYLELHTGPGRGYPIFHVIDRGATIEVVMQRTDWYLVRNEKGIEGWVNRDEMEKTLVEDGSNFTVARADLGDFTTSRWEIGALAGDFGGANIVSLYGGYSLNPNVSIEAWGSQILGNFSNGWTASVNVVHEAWPDWRISPFFTLGAGVIYTEPKTSIIQGEDRTDQIGHAGIGFRAYITRQFLFRAEYKTYVVFTSRNDNEEIEEWKVGFAFFF